MKPFLDIVYTDSMIGIFVGMCMFAVLAIKDDTLVCQFDAYFNKGRLLIAHAMLESVFQQGYEKQGRYLYAGHNDGKLCAYVQIVDIPELHQGYVILQELYFVFQ